MVLAKIDPERFAELVRKSVLIAFQKLEFGYAVAASGEAYYAPIDHPGGGNLPPEWRMMLEHAALRRMSTPAYRTLRPTSKPIPSQALVEILRISFPPSPEPMSNYDKISGDHPAVVESETQVVIQAILEHERPDLKDAMGHLKRDMLSDALDLVIQNATSARELCEVGDDKPALVKMYLLQCTTAMKTALEMLLSP
jgi:hypothetical protein